MLDGLDEVQKADHDRILQDIKDFTHEFRNCQFVMTCRIAAREYTFQQFTEVEVADFNREQIAEFAAKWFKAKQDPEKGITFVKRLNNNKPIQELATNPLLLTLLCLVFGEAADFPSNRSELYKEGLDVLLKKWDAKRNIERDQVYKKLSLKRKEDLLSQLAFQAFERGGYFFKQKVVEQKIIDYIRNFPEANEDEEALQLDSEAVLKSIEAQHGLLVERARGIYSFSHLTFQEYFTAKQITSPTSQLPAALSRLAAHVAETRYREIFLLTLGMLPEVDELLQLMKQQTDQLMDEPSLQVFSSWVYEKSESVDVSYKPAAVRAFYFALALALDQYRDRDSVIDHTVYLYRTLDRDRDLTLAIDHTLDQYRAHMISLDLTVAFALSRALALDRTLALYSALDRATEKADESDLELKSNLKALGAQLPNREDSETMRAWWKTTGEAWAGKLRSVVTEYCNIGHDWQFNNMQKEKLRQYYDANKLLVDCLNSDCYVTKATRQKIEETLLLPMSEIEKRKGSG